MKYKQVISLGNFCGVAMELERIGLRSASYPFDWLITSDFNEVIKQIVNHFESFLEDLEPEEIKNHYWSPERKMHFFHDFKSNGLSYETQLKTVKKKYDRRIARFYEDIKQPTLFIRYLTEEDKITDGLEVFCKTLLEYNPKNKIVFIKNGESASFDGQIVTVVKPENDSLARRFMKQVPSFRDFLVKNIDIPWYRRYYNIFRNRKNGFKKYFERKLKTK